MYGLSLVPGGAVYLSVSQSLSLSLSLKPSSKGCCPRFLLAVERSACSSVLCVQYFLSIHAAMDVSFLVDSVIAVSTISFKDSFSMQVCVQLQRIIHWQRAAATTRCRPPHAALLCAVQQSIDISCWPGHCCSKVWGVQTDGHCTVT